MVENEINLDPVDQIKVDAIGEPGKRVFYLMGQKSEIVVSLVIKKFQLQSLIANSDKFMGEIYEKYLQLKKVGVDYREADMIIHPPLDPRFRVGYLGLAYDHSRDLICLIASEMAQPPIEEEDSTTIRFWCTRTQFINLVHWGTIVIERGREICPQCLQPMDPNGHFCPKKNGHKKSKKV